MTPEHSTGENLYLHVTVPRRIAVLGEVLWDVFPHSSRLGGAPLNFAAHARRLGHDVCLISAVGADDLGRQAAEEIDELDLDTSFLQRTTQFPTGTAEVEMTEGDQTSFKVQRPAAYDAIQISDPEIVELRRRAPEWLYYGTLFPSFLQNRTMLETLLDNFDRTVKFYDLNLRPGFDSPELVEHLLKRADVVKLNEEELQQVHEFSGLPLSIEAFCSEGSARYGWNAVAVTLGGRGCAVTAGGKYVEAQGCLVDVADPVGAGDAFAAAFMHGLSSNWPLTGIAAFANRIGALVASRDGAIPYWTLEEAVAL